MEIVITIITGVIGNPTIALGLVALIGMLLLRKSAPSILLGVVKTMLGYLILMGGAGMIVTALTPLTDWIREALGVQGVIPLYWPVYSQTMAQFGTQVALVFIIGFFVNILLARITPWPYLGLTVHLQLFWAGFMVVVLDAAHIDGIGMFILGGLICGVYYWVVPWISSRFIQPYTKEFANFVPSIVGVLVTGFFGLFFKGGKSTEDIELPEGLSWFKDTIVTISVAMFVVNLIFGLAAGIPNIEKEAAGTYWPTFMVLTSLGFGASVAVILYGVRMLLAEIIPAFVGISQKLLPNAKLGLDYPTIYPFAGTAVILGFLFHLAGSIIATLVMVATHFSPLVVPGVQINFFEGALIGVYANSRGGLRNVICSCLLIGFILQFGVAFTFPYTGTMVSTGYAYEAIDFNTIGLVIVKLLSLLHP